jgi:integrase
MRRSTSKLTERFVNGLKPPATGQDFHWDGGDGAVKGFGVGITAAGTRTYVAQGRVNGKSVRLKIGLHGNWNADEARKEAKDLLRSMESGVDPREEKLKAKAQGITLRQVMEDYCAHKKTRLGFPLKDRTKADIKRHVTVSFKDWTDKPVASITPDACLKRFREMSVTGPVSANQALRVLRALLNAAREASETAEGVATILPQNPVSKIKKKWNAEIPREGRIPHDMIGLAWNWLQARRESARTIDDRSSADLVAMLLLTGARLGEMCNLEWEHVKLAEDSGSFHLPDPKNRRAVTLPLNAPARDILRARLALLEEDDPERERRAKRERPEAGRYVFASWGKSGHITEVKKTLAALSALCDEHLTAHDMRRTFADAAEEAGVTHTKLKGLINHVHSTDTLGRHYANSRDPRKLALASEAIGEWIVRQGVLAAGKNVVALRA